MKSVLTFLLCIVLAGSLSAQWSTNGSNIYFNSGNVGFGTSTPGARISFSDVGTNADGIGWHATDPVNYGIYRTPGSWSSPNYQQLSLTFVTGIILDPGSNYGKSYVDVRGGGLRITSGNVGIGTAGALQKLDVRGNLLLESGSDATIYTGTGTAELNRYMHFINSPNHETASGLKAGGVLVADNYSYANPGKNDLIVKGNVGIGALPAAKFHLSGGDMLLQNSGSGYPSLYMKDVSGSNSLRLDYNSIIHSGGHLYIRSGDGANLLINDVTGANVGIGTSAPAGKLDVNGGNLYAIRASASTRYLMELRNTGDSGGGWWFVSDSNGDFAVHQNNVGDQFTIRPGGNVGIGTTTPDAKLSVKGQVHAQEVKVDLNGAVAPDYVFNKDYKLPSLEEIKSYIEKNSHLPEVPSAKEMEENGINVGEMNLVLLKKIEEMTLYQIEMQQQLQSLAAEIKTLKTDPKR